MPTHFAHPPRLTTNPDGTVSLATVEQDTVPDIAACVARVASFRVGSRDELPEFGVTDLAFQQASVDTRLLQAQLERWEPRADLDVDELMDAAMPSHRVVRAAVTRRGT